MKRLIVFSAAALALILAGCTAEPIPQKGGNEITITATVAENNTKTLIQDGTTSVLWEPAEEVKVFYKTTGSKFTSNNTEPTGVADFTGTLTITGFFAEGFTADTPLWGLYPYREDAVSDGESVTTTLPYEQTGRDGSFAKEMNITLAKSTNTRMAFYNVCGGVRFTLTREGIRSIVFQGQNGEDIAGTVKVAFIDGLPAVQDVIEGHKSITLTAPDNGTFETGKWYYIVALPGTLSNGFKMIFNMEGESIMLKSSKSVTIKRGIFGSLTDADSEAYPEIDLSADGTANSYIVTGPGYYYFKTVKGNSLTSAGTVASAEVLWETFGTDVAPTVGDLVSDVTYSDGNIYFKASDKKGNALVAAKDASGNILWSWHIWMTDKPVDRVYRNNAGTMMDRNLGATSTTPGDVHALGLLYQWGRKDPFLAGKSITSKAVAASTLDTWPITNTSDILENNIALNYSIAHPTTFLLGPTSPFNWYCTNSSYTNNNLWAETKTIYDPCPSGYSVPSAGYSGIWHKAAGSTSLPSWDSTNRGCDFGGVFTASGSCWYPACGQITYGEAGRSTGLGGYYWSYTITTSNVWELLLESNRVDDTMTSKYRSSGRSVRCMKSN